MGLREAVSVLALAGVAVAAGAGCATRITPFTMDASDGPEMGADIAHSFRDRTEGVSDAARGIDVSLPTDVRSGTVCPAGRCRVVRLRSVESGMYALLASGQVLVWGRNPGWPDVGPEDFISVPTLIPVYSDLIDLAGGYSNICILHRSGQVDCGGVNNRGQLGRGTCSDGCMDGLALALARIRPTWHPLGPVPGLTDAVEIVGNHEHMCALRRHGRVVCWGSNESGRLGDDRRNEIFVSPTPVVGVIDAVQISAGYRTTCALRSMGQVVCWGANDYLQLGRTSTPTSTGPQPVPGVEGAVQISESGDTACARLASGRVVCWGACGDFECGSLATRETAPRLVPGIQDAVDLAMDPPCVVHANGRVTCWGSRRPFDLGRGEARDMPEPGPVLGLTDATSIRSGCVLRRTGGVACWGVNIDGSLGDGTTISRGIPAPVLGLE